MSKQPYLEFLCLRPCQEEGARKGALTKSLKIRSWNVRTLMDNSKADRPERRTALVARELAHYHVDVAAHSETRRANEGQLTEDGGGYCFFWSGRSSEERREAGVGFAIRPHLISKLSLSIKMSQ